MWKFESLIERHMRHNEVYYEIKTTTQKKALWASLAGTERGGDVQFHPNCVRNLSDDSRMISINGTNLRPDEHVEDGKFHTK